VQPQHPVFVVDHNVFQSEASLTFRFSSRRNVDRISIRATRHQYGTVHELSFEAAPLRLSDGGSDSP
jgi:hypothetical protein